MIAPSLTPDHGGREGCLKIAFSAGCQRLQASPRVLAAASVSGASTTFGFLGLTSNAIVLVEGSSSRRNSKRFGPSMVAKTVTPVRLLPGRLKLSTRPVLTGSAPVMNTDRDGFGCRLPQTTLGHRR